MFVTKIFKYSTYLKIIKDGKSIEKAKVAL